LPVRRRRKYLEKTSMPLESTSWIGRISGWVMTKTSGRVNSSSLCESEQLLFPTFPSLLYP
jgi:hypothetical protein